MNITFRILILMMMTLNSACIFWIPEKVGVTVSRPFCDVPSKLEPGIWALDISSKTGDGMYPINSIILRVTGDSSTSYKMNSYWTRLDQRDLISTVFYQLDKVDLNATETEIQFCETDLNEQNKRTGYVFIKSLMNWETRNNSRYGWAVAKVSFDHETLEFQLGAKNESRLQDAIREIPGLVREDFDAYNPKTPADGSGKVSKFHHDNRDTLLRFIEGYVDFAHPEIVNREQNGMAVSSCANLMEALGVIAKRHGSDYYPWDSNLKCDAE